MGFLRREREGKRERVEKMQITYHVQAVDLDATSLLINRGNPAYTALVSAFCDDDAVALCERND